MFNGNLINDCNVLESELKKLKLHHSNNRRFINEGKSPISCVYGYVQWGKYSNGVQREESTLYPGFFKSKLMTNYPDFDNILKEFARYHLPPDFEFNTVVINKNFKTTKHIDSNNVGMSYIIGLGNYLDGELIILDEEGNETMINIKNKVFGFNGSKVYHYTNNFVGTRYSLVFYNNKNLKEKI
jgi:hypothetical protein